MAADPERERLVRAVEEAAEMYDATDFCSPQDYTGETKRAAHLLADARAALAAYDAAHKEKPDA